MPELRYNGEPALPPQEADLKRLYDLLIKFRALIVLEFGCGYSTYVIDQALNENKQWFYSLDYKPEIRNYHAFCAFSVDTNQKWITEVGSKKFPLNVVFQNSTCIASTYNGQICHFYSKLPDVVPDFIYLDGPDPKEVFGNVNGLSWKCAERTPISADILTMESILIPGTHILIDGRTNNARFLARNLKRRWDIEENIKEDYTLMYLKEPRLGKINVVGRDILECLEQQNKK